MRSVARENVEDFCRSIANRSLTSVECENLFVTLREEFPASGPPTPDSPLDTTSKVRDLGHSMAHKCRDLKRGYISRYLSDFADRWRAEQAKEGERSIEISPVYPIEDIYRELFFKLTELDIFHDAQAMLDAEYHLVTRIGWALDGRRVQVGKGANDFCTFIGDVSKDSRFAQPGCVFNNLLVKIEDWGDEDEPALFGVPTDKHALFAVPLLKNFTSKCQTW